jgi:transcriptional regulator with XRE-family HTH domain
MGRFKWDSESDAILAGMKRAGISQKKIAERLGASIRQVGSRAAILGSRVSLIKGTAGRLKTMQRANKNVPDSIYLKQDGYDDL